MMEIKKVMYETILVITNPFSTLNLQFTFNMISDAGLLLHLQSVDELFLSSNQNAQ